MSSYCAKCKWNMGRFNSHCMECHCGSGYEEKHDDRMDSLYYVTTGRAGGKRWLYEQLLEAARNNERMLTIPRKNGLSQVEKLKEKLNMSYERDGKWSVSNMYFHPGIKDVIFNDPATIVLWSDNTKTVVKAHNEPFDLEKGLAMAICKKLYGNKGSFNNIFKKWIPEEKIIANDVIDAFNKVMNEPEESEESEEKIIADDVMNEPIAETTEIKLDSKGLTIKAQRNNIKMIGVSLMSDGSIEPEYIIKE